MRWLLAANLLFVLGGVVSYFTPITPGLGVAVALVAASPGLMELRAAGGTQALWIDRSLSAAAGTWAVVAVLIVLPTITVEESTSLWSSRPYAALSLAVAAGGMLLWNVSAALGMGADSKSMRLNTLFHAFMVALAAYLVLGGDGSPMMVSVRGLDVTGIDLKLAPALAAVPGVVWAMHWARQRVKEPST